MMDRGKKAPMKNCRGMLITVAIEEAASPSFAKEEIMRPIPIEVSEPKKIKAIINGMFQKSET